MKRSSPFLVLFALLVYFSVVWSATPTQPQWPSQFHAQITIAENAAGTVLANSTSIPTTFTGSYFYDNATSSIALSLTHRYSSQKTREVVIEPGTAAVIDLASDKCTFNKITSKHYWKVFDPDFVTLLNFAFLGWDYFVTIEGEALLETHHWQLRNGSQTIDYWHATGTNTPFRLAWSGTNVVVLQFSNFIATFSDVPNVFNYYFQLPENCATNQQQHQPTKQQAQIKAPPATGNAWPFAWHGLSRYTGNDFGLQDTNTPVIPFTLAGEYYYDWSQQRECNIWSDLVTGQKTKTLIINQTFHLVTMATGKCQLIPTYPVNGPLKPIWPTGLPYIDNQWLYLKDENSFLNAHHFRFDALNIGVQHAFHYWQSQDGTPRMFQGPVLEFWPYGQSMMQWGEVVLGLDGVDLDYVFGVPNDCSYIPLEDWKKSVDSKMHGLISHLHLIHKHLNSQ